MMTSTSINSFGQDALPREIYQNAKNKMQKVIEIRNFLQINREKNISPIKGQTKFI